MRDLTTATRVSLLDCSTMAPGAHTGIEVFRSFTDTSSRTVPADHLAEFAGCPIVAHAERPIAVTKARAAEPGTTLAVSS
jgi:hypothetical protein